MLALPGCETLGLDRCPPGLKAAATAELFFGRGIADRDGVSETDWARFVDEEVTPRFPDGLTVLDARGQWRAPGSASVVRERSKVLVIVLGGAKDDDAKLDAIRDAYKRRFHQQSVLLVRHIDCVGF